MKEPHIQRRKAARSIYRIPALLAVISLFGLVAALMVEGPIDLLWTAAIAAPLLVIGIFMIR